SPRCSPSLHDALPISSPARAAWRKCGSFHPCLRGEAVPSSARGFSSGSPCQNLRLTASHFNYRKLRRFLSLQEDAMPVLQVDERSEEHTSDLQSRENL